MLVFIEYEEDGKGFGPVQNYVGSNSGVVVNAEAGTWYYRDPKFGVFRIGRDKRVPEGDLFGPAFLWNSDDDAQSAEANRLLQEAAQGRMPEP